MQIQITAAGLAKLQAGTGPIILQKVILGDGHGYIPSPIQDGLHGNKVWEGFVSAPFVVNANIVKYGLYLDYDTGDFEFGEALLYDQDNDLFAVAAGSATVSKIKNDVDVGNSIRMDFYVSSEHGNFVMWLDWAATNNKFRLATLASIDGLPPSRNAVPNAYIVRGAMTTQSSFMAFSDTHGLWHFDAYRYSSSYGLQYEVLGAGPKYVVVKRDPMSETLEPHYFGERIVQFTTGKQYGICRYLEDAMIDNSVIHLYFATPLQELPQVGDKFTAYSREAGTTLIDIPIATTDRLGGIIVGEGLEVKLDGTLSVKFPAASVTSVNGMTGDVVIPDYKLPTASAGMLGGIRIGAGLKVDPATGITSVDVSVFPSAPVTSVNGMTGDVVVPKYTLPVATKTELGGVKVGAGLTVTVDGLLALDPLAIPTVPVTSVNGKTGAVVLTADDIEGLVKTVNNIGPDAQGNIVIPPYKLPVATDTVLGGVKIEQSGGLKVTNDGQVTVDWTKAPVQTIPIASTERAGIMRVGDGLEVTPEGLVSVTPTQHPTPPVLSVNAKTGHVVLKGSDIEGVVLTVNGQAPNTAGNVNIPGYVLPPATDFSRGGIRVGDGLEIDGDVLSVDPSYAPVKSVNGKTGVVVLKGSDIEGVVLTFNGAAPDAAGNVEYAPPLVTETTAGIMRVGEGLKVNPATGTVYLDIGSLPGSPVTSVNGKTGDVVIPKATTTVSGLVTIGEGLKVTDGKVSLDIGSLPGSPVTSVNGQTGDVVIPAYTLPTATPTRLGGIKTGASLLADADGLTDVDWTKAPVVSVNGKTGAVTIGLNDIQGIIKTVNGQGPDAQGNVVVDTGYALPVATSSVLGGIKVGETLIIDQGTLNVRPHDSLVTMVNGKTGNVVLTAADIQGTVRSVGGTMPDSNGNVTIPYATPTTPGLIKIGTGLTISQGVISVIDPLPGYVKTVNNSAPDAQGNVTVPGYTLPTASATVLGGVKIGSGIKIASGVISLDTDALPVAPVTTVNGKTGAITLTAADIQGAVRTVNGISPNASGALSIPDGSATIKGLLRVGAGLKVAGGIISLSDENTSAISGALLKANNLSDLANVVTARNNLGLGNAALQTILTDAEDGTDGRVIRLGDAGTGAHPSRTVDFNDLPQLYPWSGFVPILLGTGSANRPASGLPGAIAQFYHVMQTFYQRTANTGNVTQLAIPYRAADADLYYRSRFEGTWSEWQRILSTRTLSNEVLSGLQYRRDWVVTSATSAHWAKAFRVKGVPGCRATITVTGGAQGTTQGAANTAGYSVMSITKGNVVSAEPGRDSLAMQYINSQGSNPSVAGIHIVQEGTAGDNWVVWVQARSSTKIIMSYVGDFAEVETFSGVTQADRPTSGYDKASSIFNLATTAQDQSLGSAAYRDVWTGGNNRAQLPDVDNVNQAGLFYQGSYLASNSARTVDLDNDAEDFYGLAHNARVKSEYLDTIGVDYGAYWYVRLQRQYASTRLQFLYGYGQNEIFFRSRRESNPTLPFARIWHSSNLPVQTSFHDATRGVVQKVGAFGIGSFGAAATYDVFPSASLNDLSVPSGVYYVNSAILDRPVGAETYTLWHRQIGSSGAQIMVSAQSNTLLFRGRSSGVYKDWVTLGSGGSGTVTSVNGIAPDAQGNVTLPPVDLSGKANTTTQIIAGTGLSGGGTLAANRTLTLRAATSTVIGGVKPGAGLSVAADGTISASGSNPATPTTAGVVKPGDGLTVTADGTLNVAPHPVVATGTASSFPLTSFAPNSYMRKTGTSEALISVATSAAATPDEWHFRQVETGAIRIAGAAGVTINPPYGGTLTTAGPGATITLKRVAANVYDLFGQTTSA